MTLDDVIHVARRVASDITAVDAERVDSEAMWPEKTLRALLEAGLGGLVVPRDAGGLGHGMLAVARVCEILAQQCPSSALCFGMHLVGSAVLAAKATDHHRDEYLRPICDGRHITTLALSEPGTGSHFWIPQTTVIEEDCAFIVTGTKSFVTNGARADSYVLSVSGRDHGIGPGTFSCIVVPADSDGLHWGPLWAGLGMRGNTSRNVQLRGVHITRANLLGDEGDQLWYVFEVVAPYFLVAMAGTYLGIAGAALDDVCVHLLERQHAHTAQPLAANGVIQHRVGQLWATVERTRRLVYHAASNADGGREDGLPALLSAKAECDDCAVEVTNEAMTLAGGSAYGANSAVARRLRDARAAKVMAPTTDTLRLWTGRALLGRPLLLD